MDVNVNFILLIKLPCKKVAIRFFKNYRETSFADFVPGKGVAC